jgi:hypothetical protein
MFGRADAGLPRLDAFDKEFGPGPATILREPRPRTGLRFWTAIVLVLGAGVISALALGWPPSDSWLRSETTAAAPPLRPAARDGGDEQVTRLQREIAVLKHQIRELTGAQQQAADTIAALQAAAQDSQSRVAAGYWYSDAAALTFGIVSRAEVGAVEPSSRRPATVRARPDLRGRDNGSPLSLEPPPN